MLNLVQGIVAFHLGRDREAQILLEKCAVQMQMLAVCETDLLEIASMGYTIAEARLGLRAAQGDRKLAVEQIMKRREKKRQDRETRRKEKQNRKQSKQLNAINSSSELLLPAVTNIAPDLKLLGPFGNLLRYLIVENTFTAGPLEVSPSLDM